MRVSIACALCFIWLLFLVDESLIHVENFKKNTLRRTLFRYLKEHNIACIVATHDSDDALSFSDRMVVIKNNRVHAIGSPGDLFQNPPSKYVASLFDDVNEIEKEGRKTLLYPDQIKIVHHSKVKAKVLRSYYKGTHWLVEMDFEGQVIFVNHPEELPPDKEVSLEFLCD